MRVCCTIQPPNHLDNISPNLPKFKLGEKYRADEKVARSSSGRRVTTYVLYLPSIDYPFNPTGEFTAACEISKRTFNRFFLRMNWG